MDATDRGTHPRAPILQQLFDCSNRQAEISGLVMLTCYSARPPEAVIFHDAEGLAVNAFLTQVARTLSAMGSVGLTAHTLRGDADGFQPVQVAGDINISARVAAQASTEQVAERLGMSEAELVAVLRAARAAYADFVPSLPEPAALGRRPERVRVVAAHDQLRRASGYLVISDTGKSAAVLHDVNPASTLAVNAYLSAVVADLAADAWRLAERSLKEVDDGFCRVSRCLADESALPVRSTGSVALDQVADDLRVRPEELARLADQASDLRRWRSPFQSARPLRVRPPAAPAGHAEVMGVA